MSDGDPDCRKAQAAIRKAEVNRDRARRKLLIQRRRLAKRRERNVERGRRRKDRTDSTEDNDNPTAISLLPAVRDNRETAVQHTHSSVPEKPRYSGVEPSERLYGLFFECRSTQEDQNE